MELQSSDFRNFWAEKHQFQEQKEKPWGNTGGAGTYLGQGRAEAAPCWAVSTGGSSSRLYLTLPTPVPTSTGSSLSPHSSFLGFTLISRKSVLSLERESENAPIWGGSLAEAGNVRSQRPLRAPGASKGTGNAPGGHRERWDEPQGLMADRAQGLS